MEVGAGTNKRGILEGDIDNGTVMVGQSLNVLNEVMSCQEVMDKLVAEAKAAIERIKGLEF